MEDIFDLKKFNELSTQFKVEKAEKITDINNISFEVDDEFEIVNKIYYELAGAIGLLSGGLDILFAQEFSFENFANVGQNEAEKIIYKQAKKYGYDGDKLDGAIRKLEKKFEWCADKVENQFGGGKYHHFRDFTHHASPFGLSFAIIAQFTKKVWGIDKNGLLISVDLSDELIGETKKQKFEFATIIWSLHIASDIAGSSGEVRKGGHGTGVPGNIISALEALAILLQKTGIIKGNDNWADELAKKLFKVLKGKDNSDIKIDKRFEMGLAKYVKSQAFPVIFNELLTRATYLVCKLYYEIKEKKISNINDIEKIDFNSVAPISNRVLTRMLSISSFTFVVVNGTKATVKGLLIDGNPYMIFRHINYIGVGRFVVAIYCDKDYLIEDWQKYVKYYKKRKIQLAKIERKALADFKYFKLNKNETRVLYSIKIQKVLYDIEQTKNIQEKEEKNKWLNKFILKTKEELKIDDDNFFYINKNIAFKKANKLLKKHWYNTIFRKDYDSILIFSFTMQLMAFDKYDNFDINDNFKIKFSSDFEKDNYEKLQKLLSYKDYQEIKKTYDGYKTAVSGSLFKIGATIVVATVATTITGGVALVFAPSIAVALVGSGLALHGAALTSASLAIMGGGPLAVGGFGVFGGTAVITGGGALIGLIGSGVASSTTMRVFVASNQVMYQCAELLAYSKIIIANRCHDLKHLQNIEDLIQEGIDECDSGINSFKENKKEKNDVKVLKGLKDSRSYLNNAKKEIQKIIKQYEKDTKI